MSRQSGDNARRTPGHGHRAIVDTLLICIVIHFNIAMDSGSASILLILVRYSNQHGGAQFILVAGVRY